MGHHGLFLTTDYNLWFLDRQVVFDKWFPLNHNNNNGKHNTSNNNSNDNNTTNNNINNSNNNPLSGQVVLDSTNTNYNMCWTSGVRQVAPPCAPRDGPVQQQRQRARPVAYYHDYNHNYTYTNNNINNTN